MIKQSDDLYLCFIRLRCSFNYFCTWTDIIDLWIQIFRYFSLHFLIGILYIHYRIWSFVLWHTTHVIQTSVHTNENKMAQAANKTCEICMRAPGLQYCTQCDQIFCDDIWEIDMLTDNV
jgi:hypothetical protein